MRSYMFFYKGQYYMTFAHNLAEARRNLESSKSREVAVESIVTSVRAA